MRRVFRFTVVFLAAAVTGIQFVRPQRINPPTAPREALESHLHVPPPAAAILSRACGDCHSNGTRWPWYSQVAPVSWFVADHVNHGRSHLNFSRWGTYDRERRTALLDNACRMARDGSMPMASYLLLHPDAKLSPADIDTLCHWTRTARH